MQDLRDNYNFIDGNNAFEISILSVIGDRPEQQDSSGYLLKANEGIVIVCDGMGGLNGGKMASSIAVDHLISAYENRYLSDSPYEMLSTAVYDLDKDVFELEDQKGEQLGAGSTLVAVIIKENAVSWLSVGDSRIYVKRKDEFVCVTKDQNYKMILDQRKELNDISEEEYQIEIIKGEGLISYLGINGLPVIDCNNTPVRLESGDKILLTTDGLYKMLGDDEIKSILGNFSNNKDALIALETKTQRASRMMNKKRDNITMALIEVR